MTDFETGQLVGRVGTPEDPLFTYEQAIHYKRGRDDVQLVVGADIPTEERHHLSGATISELSTRQTTVEGHKLPKLPRGVVPRGWDGWGRSEPRLNSREPCHPGKSIACHDALSADHYSVL